MQSLTYLPDAGNRIDDRGANRNKKWLALAVLVLTTVAFVMKPKKTY